MTSSSDSTHRRPSPVPIHDAAAGKAIGPPGPDGSPAPEAARQPAGLSPETLERVRRRETQALAEFFERYFDHVYGLVYRLLGERAAAEDMAQEVFLKVYRAVQNLDTSRDPKPWLTTIAYNACRDMWRSGSHRMGQRSGSIEGNPVIAGRLTLGTNDPERDLLAQERSRLVLDALARLPEPLRVAVVLHEYQGMSHQEIADLTGVNHAAARKRYSRALAALGKMLKESFA